MDLEVVGPEHTGQSVTLSLPVVSFSSIKLQVRPTICHAGSLELLDCEMGTV